MPKDPEIEILDDEDKPKGIELDLEDESGGGGIRKSASVSDDDVAKLVADLKAQKTAAEAEAKRHKNDASTARSRVAEVEGKVRETETRLTGEVEGRLKAQEDTIVAGISSVEGEIKALRDNVAQLQAEGKWTEAADAIEAMTDAQARKREFASQKAQIDNYRTNLKAQPKTPVADTSPKVSDATAEWIARHPKFNTNRVYNAKVMAAHMEAVEELGLAPDSDEYFNHIETSIGERKPQVTEDDDAEVIAPRKPAVKTRVDVAAPVQRRAEQINGTQRTPNKITLSGEEVEQADSLFGEPGTSLYIKEPKDRYKYFWDQKTRLQGEGRLPK